MTRKSTRNYSLSVIAPFFAILTLLVAAVVLAQTSGADRPIEKENALLTQTAPVQAERPVMLWADGTARSPVGGRQTKRNGASPTGSNLPLFLPAVTYDSGGTSCSGEGLPFRWIAVADVNGDGKRDVVTANCGSGTVSVLLGNGDGTFQPAVTYDSGGQAPLAIAIADVNRDGKPDIVVANSGSGTVGVLLGNGDGTFQPAVTYDSGGPPADLVVADVNRDGKPDLVVVTCSTDGCFDPGGGSGGVAGQRGRHL